MARLRLWLVYRLMGSRTWPWLPGDVQRWAVHEHLMTFESYRKLSEAS